jgi:hypothetical protein
MSLDSFHRIDLMVESSAEPPEPRRFIAVNTRGWLPEDEALLTLQAIIKFTMYERRAADQIDEAAPPALELVTTEEPPDTLLLWLRDRGVQCTTIDGELRRPSVGRPSGYADDGHGRPALGPLVEAAARRFAEEHGLAWPPTQASLVALDGVIDARRAEAGFGPEEESPDLEDGELLVLAGSYAGECARCRYGGTWRYEPQQGTPLVLATGEGERVRVNLHGKVDKYLCNGAGDSLAGLVAALAHHVGAT